MIEVNDNLVRFTGAHREELVGKTIESLFRGSAGAERATISAILRSGKAVRDLELELAGSDRDGRGRTVLLSAEPVDLDGEPCLLSVLCDVSARRAAAAGDRFRRGEPTP